MIQRFKSKAENVVFAAEINPISSTTSKEENFRPQKWFDSTVYSIVFLPSLLPVFCLVDYFSDLYVVCILFVWFVIRPVYCLFDLLFIQYIVCLINFTLHYICVSQDLKFNSAHRITSINDNNSFPKISSKWFIIEIFPELL